MEERESLLGSTGEPKGRLAPGTPMYGKQGGIRAAFGNFKPKGGDQVKPPDIHFSYIASFFIIAPTLYVLVYS